jgi:L-seryl-tRNA(Ser) seleniumtransferase
MRREMETGKEGPGDAVTPATCAARVRERLALAELPSLRSVINATGVVLHTNLGRAPLAAAAREAMARAGEGYTNLEYDLVRGRRGSRYVHCAELLRELTGAEDALVVNNNAAALVLILNTLARGRAVLVSRGELVEIGGGFRLPEMLERAGARLVEVGTTNRTRDADYREAAARHGAAAILKVHRSNFRISGFTEEASLASLARVAGGLGVPLVHDLGSGLLVDAAALGLPAEPRPGDSLDAGADLVAFSGDKLLGGPQAGLIAGRGDLVDALRRNPLCRALRVDKVTLAGIEATLRLHRDFGVAVREVPALAALAARPEELAVRAQVLADAARASGLDARVGDSRALVGGGTYPDVEIPSVAVRVAWRGLGAHGLAEALRAGDPPVVAREEDDWVVLDVRTLAAGDVDRLARRFLDLVRPSARPRGAAPPTTEGGGPRWPDPGGEASDA